MNRISVTILLIIFYFVFAGCSDQNSERGFILATDNEALTFYVDKNADDAVLWAANTFADDIRIITGNRPDILTAEAVQPGKGIYISTTGKPLAGSYKGILPEKLQGSWEAYNIQNDKNNLYITGSDIRGTIFGIFEVSEQLGISPWEWWADVKPMPEKIMSLDLPEGGITDKPDVQYRGIFINDEDWGLQPWAAKTFEPETGDIGPKTYEKVFQLLLRLKANTIWPAMHPCTKGFYQIKGNREMADKYHIVVGTSHCEPMMRNNVAEWDSKKYGDYNFYTNKKKVCEYWQERIDEVRNDEDFITIGMRGIHDGMMSGAKNTKEAVQTLEKIMSCQRDMLEKTMKKPAEKIPQTIVIYKEVLKLYNAGLKIPDDVTLMWCDDNFGYLTRLSNKYERNRKGGSGVYYHLSYWGPPHDYLWLSTTQPAQIWTEMTRAYENGARKIWIANVGDIKPAEYNIEFFLDLAWDVKSIDKKTIYQHLRNWAAREFGPDISDDIANIKNEYYRLAFIRKPELMGWSRVEPMTRPVRPSQFNSRVNGNEQKRRIEMYSAIMDLCDKLKSKIPGNRKDAWFQLVEYPVKCAGLMNMKFLYAQMALEAKDDEKERKKYSELSASAYNQIVSLTGYYNDKMSNGKWKYIMSMHPRNLPVFNLPDFTHDSSFEKYIPRQENKKGNGKRIFFQADENTALVGKEGFTWQTIEGLGYSNCAITLFPMKMKHFGKKKPRIQYSFYLDKPATYNVQVRFLPTQSNNNDQQVGIRINYGETKYFDLNPKVKGTKWKSKNWCTNVSRNSVIVNLKHKAEKPGEEIIRIYVNQTGIIIDQVAVDFSMDQPFYEIPVE